MKTISLNCPNCGANYDPANQNCAYCGSYIIISNKEEENYTPDVLSSLENVQESKPIYIQGVCMQANEIPIRNGTLGKYKNALLNDVGRMLLTSKRLIFNQNNKIFKQSDEITLEFLLSDINSIRPAHRVTMRKIYFDIVTQKGEKYSFNAPTHKSQQVWIEKITAAIQEVRS
ncbi:MAG: hypothetical protein FWF94_07875 [Oscillospiraceae bacterium]|nr:hypothetical protein [Oscillospiraceae bacterium]